MKMLNGTNVKKNEKKIQRIYNMSRNMENNERATTQNFAHNGEKHCGVVLPQNAALEEDKCASNLHQKA
jgi:hypothetical protein